MDQHYTVNIFEALKELNVRICEECNMHPRSSQKCRFHYCISKMMQHMAGVVDYYMK